MQQKFKCLMVRQSGKTDSSVTRSIEQIGIDDLPPGEIVVKTSFSALNYKDALAATGHRGVVSSLPHVPGIDAAGVVVSSDNPDLKIGDEVKVFHAKFGTESFGGYSQYVRVARDWVYPLPAGMSLRDAMIYGTAGFTAAQSIRELIRHNIQPENGEIVVTGATGGVGSLAVGMLAKLGYSVVAATGKTDQTAWLEDLGANAVIHRNEVNDRSRNPLLKARWAGAVDTVGGNTLATILRSTKIGGCVTACGLVGGHELSLTVYPFILRGVTLQGIDSANIEYETRNHVWQMLAADFALANLDNMAREVGLEDLESEILAILDGKITGRVVVKID